MSDNSSTGLSQSRVDHEVLLAAIDNGYLESPPQVSVADIASECDLAEQEAKRRLARGLAGVLREYREDESTDGLLADPTTRRF